MDRSLQSPTVVAVDPADATMLLRVLPGLPGGGDEHRPVTIDANRVVRVRGRDPATGEVRDTILTRSRAEGPAAVIAVDRRVLARALTLGCRVLRLTPDKPVVIAGGDVTLVAAGLDPDLVVPTDAAGLPTTFSKTVVTNDNIDTPNPNIPNPERRTDVRAKPTETNGPAAPRCDPPDPLVVAESLRDALADAAAKATRLVTLLRTGRKEKRVLAGVLAGLKQLNLDAPSGQP